MRTLLLALLLSTTLCTPARAQVAAAVQQFDEGNRQYLEGNYAAAVDAYQKALAAGYASDLLFYNLGNAYYRLDEFGQAIRYYEKARRMMPENRQLAHNLSIVRARLADQFSQVPAPFWRVWWRKVVAGVGAWGLFFGGFVFYLIAAGLWGYRIRRGTRNPWRRRALAVSAVLGAVLLTAAFAASLGGEARRGVVVADRVDLRAEPNETAESERVIHEGVVVDVTATEGEWVKVRLPNGVDGWLRARALADI